MEAINPLVISRNDLAAISDIVEAGLKAGDEGLTGFEIAGADGKYIEASARIVGNSIELLNTKIAAPKSARYAWRDDSHATLFNKQGLPASSLRRAFSSKAPPSPPR